MEDEDAMVACSACGAQAPRGDMFGVEPDLLCEACAEGVRKRLHVRFRPVARDHVPRATALILAVAATIFVCDAFLWPRGPDTVRPAWLDALRTSSAIWQGAVWKHLTAMFVHAGWWHIGMNGFALWYLGRAVEQSWGTWVFAGLFVATGMAGNAAEFMAHAASPVGLSGGILGLCGFLMARRRDHPTAGAVMNEGTTRFVLIYVVGCIVLTAVSNIPIANWAHVVGLGTGWLLGLAGAHVRRRLLVPAAAALCVLLVVASVFLAFGSVEMTSGETWSRARWRTYWLERQP